MTSQPSAPRQKLSRRDAALVAAALLLPIPLFAQSGLSIPLPSEVERGLGSLITLGVDDEKTGSNATGQASTGSQDERQNGSGWLRIVPGTDAAALLENSNLSSPDPVDPDGFDRPVGDSGSGSGGTPAGSEPEGAGGGGAGSPGDSESAGADGSGADSSGADSSGAESPGSAEDDARAPAAESGLMLSIDGPGSSSELSAGEGGLGIDLGADDSGADGNELGVGIGVTQADGSSTGTGVTLPGIGPVVP